MDSADTRLVTVFVAIIFIVVGVLTLARNQL